MHLYTCKQCLDGDHENCERGTNPANGIFGGSRCICYCLGRSEKQIKEDWLSILLEPRTGIINHDNKRS